MRFAITGGCGFIGSQLSIHLLELDYDIRVIDKIAIGSSPYWSGFDYSKIDYCEVDICSPGDMDECFKDVDYVFHLASYARIKDCLANPNLARKINVGGTLNVLLAAEKNKVKRLVYTSSSSAYGDQDNLPWKEDMPIKLLNPYASTKYAGEILCQLFGEANRLETVSLRLFNVYGSVSAIEGKVDCPSVVEILLKQKRNDQALTIIGDGKQKRDLVNVKDVAKAFVAASTSKLVGKGEVINIGSGSNYSVSEIANWIGGETTKLDNRYAEAYETLADISKAKELLNWQPEHNLKDWIESNKK
ncbi:MAG: NAD-dependent epimerase/dehydratase family protein [Patescibacteria group bacterium]